MQTSFLGKLKGYFHSANQWFWQTSDRALEDAYEAVLRIKAIENEHFGGNKITLENSSEGANVFGYFQTELRNNLNTAKIRLAEFKTSRSLTNESVQKLLKVSETQAARGSNGSPRDRGAIALEKLRTIDEVLSRYTSQPKSKPSNNASKALIVSTPDVANSRQPTTIRSQPTVEEITSAETISDKASFLPRTIFGTLKRVQKELDPKTEEELVKNFRVSKYKTIISLRFILLAVLIPLLTLQISKGFFIGPVVDKIKTQETFQVFLNVDMEEEAFEDLEKFERSLRFSMLAGHTPKISEEEMEIKLKEKAEELEEEYRDKSADAIKNVFADLVSFIAFGFVIVTSQREIIVLKSFMDDLVYGLSDSAKAFIIILFTDIFVGFHSPHGWEVILEGISRHLGLPENRDFIFLFIATFPVILDTIFKYWIFRYLNRISPSAVATYRSMNE